MSYLMAGQASELERLRLQSRVWEPAGERLLAKLGGGEGLCALEVGCGAVGWLRILSRWVGPTGQVVGTDVDDGMLKAAEDLREVEWLANVRVRRDDFFASTLPEASYDLVHLRFQLAPLGHALEQVTTARRLAKPNGWIVLEEPDMGSWRENPFAPSVAYLLSLIVEAFAQSGGDFNAGRRVAEYLRAVGVDPSVRSECIALEPGHPYLQLPLQFAASLRRPILKLIAEPELDGLLAKASAELAAPDRWGQTFTLVQAWGRAT